MKFAYLFGGSPEANDLEQFASIVANVLGLPRFEERQSVNWHGGHYFKSSVSSCAILVALADHGGVEEPYWILVEEPDEGSQLEQLVGRLLRDIPASGGRLRREDDA